MLEQLKEQFKESFGQENKNAFFAPGRVNLIGEHIDYNGGLVMPCAITYGTTLLTAPNKEGIFRFRSTNFDETLDIEVNESYQKTGSAWYNYPLGVIHNFLKDEKEVEGLDMLFFGNLPIGAGLSSSASIEIVTAFAINSLFKGGLSKLDLVVLSKIVENEFIGVNSGIMDQFAVTFGEKEKTLKLNCETLDYQAVDCNLGDHLLAIINTNKPRKLAESKYNERVGECQTALKALQKELSITNLCDIDSETFEKHKHLIPDATVVNRAKHVVEENDRVELAAVALAENRLTDFGNLMYSSHDSLKNLYEVSGKELDTIVEFCLHYPEVSGARMTGAGFGGCAIALVKKDYFEDFSNKITGYYTEKIGYAPSVYSSEIGAGVREI
ncbi:galactokinase [Paradesertivirga mongoliensis]|uniref:Galactokinase n=1 Tax=Paradesertivirga mongoliensis TaxID=2100740 RepID=A0ABW4ZMA5_9SPHI|nr:galactokinase [Pedobacter mongoliensis]